MGKKKLYDQVCAWPLKMCRTSQLSPQQHCVDYP
jgi:hypothetical protein